MLIVLKTKSNWRLKFLELDQKASPEAMQALHRAQIKMQVKKYPVMKLRLPLKVKVKMKPKRKLIKFQKVKAQLERPHRKSPCPEEL